MRMAGGKICSAAARWKATPSRGPDTELPTYFKRRLPRNEQLVRMVWMIRY